MSVCHVVLWPWVKWGCSSWVRVCETGDVAVESVDVYCTVDAEAGRPPLGGADLLSTIRETVCC